MESFQNTEEIAKEIRAILTSVEDEVIRDIARYDNHGGGGVTYEQACEMHFQNLKDIIHKNDCRANWSEHSWYPMEAVELRAFTPESGDTSSFAVCTLILLLDDLEDGDRGFMVTRTSDRYLQAFQNLPRRYSDLIFEGLKVLED